MIEKNTLSKPCEGVYRLNGFGEYVAGEDWLNTWEAYPL